jgi:hypothetical protein
LQKAFHSAWLGLYQSRGQNGCSEQKSRYWQRPDRTAGGS